MHERFLPCQSALNGSARCLVIYYLQRDLDAFKKGLETEDSLIDCLWGELYGSINGAEIDDQAISHEQAEYLRDTYLRRSFR